MGEGGGQRAEDGGRRSEEKDSPVGNESTNSLIP